jgi:hypothetical protein
MVTNAIESDILASGNVARNCRAAFPTSFGDGAAASAMVLAYEPQIGTRSLFSLRDQ